MEVLIMNDKDKLVKKHEKHIEEYLKIHECVLESMGIGLSSRPYSYEELAELEKGERSAIIYRKAEIPSSYPQLSLPTYPAVVIYGD
jgi:hypothetical protein